MAFRWSQSFERTSIPTWKNVCSKCGWVVESWKFHSRPGLGERLKGQLSEDLVHVVAQKWWLLVESTGCDSKTSRISEVHGGSIIPLIPYHNLLLPCSAKPGFAFDLFACFFLGGGGYKIDYKGVSWTSIPYTEVFFLWRIGGIVAGKYLFQQGQGADKDPDFIPKWISNGLARLKDGLYGCRCRIPSHHGFAKSWSGWFGAIRTRHPPQILPDFSGRLPMTTSGCLELFFDITAFWPKIFVQNCASFNLALGPQLILFLMISLNSNIEFCGYHLIPIFDKATLLLRLYLAKIWAQEVSNWAPEDTDATITQTQTQNDQSCMWTSRHGRPAWVQEATDINRSVCSPRFSRWYPFLQIATRRSSVKSWFLLRPNLGWFLASISHPEEFQPEKSVKTA